MKFESINEVCIKWRKDVDNAILGEIKEKAIEHGIKTEYILNEKAIISALEKQIPKKPRKTRREIVCPTCSTLVGSSPYCRYCGQAIDWGDVDEKT